MTHRNIFLLGAVTALALAAQSTFGLPPSHPRRRLGLGKWMDGPGTPIDCSLSLHDYDYYLETCWDGLTMWWINGRCVSGNKQEVSELHRCHNPDGSRPYCHNCNDGRGNVKNVCGADSPDYDLVCDIAWAGDAKNCGTEELTTYSHQCLERSGGTESWYIRESYECDGADGGGEVDYGGPCGEDPKDSTFECGDAWYYPYEDDDPGLEKLGLAGNGEHPFSDPGNRYCLDCGLAIAVCAGDADATCEDLGLPKKGEEFDTTAAPFIAPRPEFTNPPVLLPALEEMEKEEEETEVMAATTTTTPEATTTTEATTAAEVTTTESPETATVMEATTTEGTAAPPEATSTDGTEAAAITDGTEATTTQTFWAEETEATTTTDATAATTTADETTTEATTTDAPEATSADEAMEATTITEATDATSADATTEATATTTEAPPAEQDLGVAAGESTPSSASLPRCSAITGVFVGWAMSALTMLL